MSQSIQIYQSNDGQVQLEITLEQDTLWLTQSQISVLFDTSTDNISLHLKNIYNEQKLDENLTAEDFSVVRQEGKRQVKRMLEQAEAHKLPMSRMHSHAGAWERDVLGITSREKR